VVQAISYKPDAIRFQTFDNAADVTLRLASKPKAVTVSGKKLSESKQLQKNSWHWQPLAKGGVLRLHVTLATRLRSLNKKSNHLFSFRTFSKGHTDKSFCKKDCKQIVHIK
jgi:hypothetical protein